MLQNGKCPNTFQILTSKNNVYCEKYKSLSIVRVCTKFNHVNARRSHKKQLLFLMKSCQTSLVNPIGKTDIDGIKFNVERGSMSVEISEK